MDEKITIEGNECIERLFDDIQEHEKVAIEFAELTSKVGSFSDNFIHSSVSMDPHSWWVTYGTFASTL